MFAALLVLSSALFWASGLRRALSLGFMASQRNMGLMVAGVGGALPELAWLYFAMSQLPIYVAPWVFQPLRRHLSGAADPADGAARGPADTPAPSAARAPPTPGRGANGEREG